MCIQLHTMYYTAVVAERLRRLTRNQIPSGSVGSNPTDCDFFINRNYSKYASFINVILIENY